MNEQLKRIPKDTIVLFSSGNTIVLYSSGVYSDYNVIGLMKALQDIDPDELRNEYINKYPGQTGRFGFKEEMFLTFLKEKKLFEVVDSPNWMEWHLGEYSDIAGMQVHPGPILFT